MRVVIACGGTGGHLFPGLAVAERLWRDSHEVRLLVSEKAIESRVLTGLDGASAGRATVRVLPAVGWTGGRRWMGFCNRLARAIRECVVTYREFAPDVVLGMGGYTSAPAVWAARWFGRRWPVALHESNAVPGRANRWSSRYADWVAVGWAECVEHFSGRPVAVTGTPLRTRLGEGRRLPGAKARLGLDAGRPTVLVMGGSQGARSLNEAVVASLPWWGAFRERVQFLHLAGGRDAESVRGAYARAGLRARVMDFCQEMEWVYSAADLAVTRAGAATLTELTAFGLPAVLVPYPSAAGNHQWHNARVLERAGAAVVVEEKALMAGGVEGSGQRLAKIVMDLIEDKPRCAAMGRAARSLARPDAAERLVEVMMRCAASGSAIGQSAR